ncbi:MAG: excinuclease ABC subunit UvrC [Patescibacteria group bacterium]
MNQTLKQQLDHLSLNSGVYQFFDKNGKLLYVGKAKVLKHRVLSYFRTNVALSPSKQEMVKQIHYWRTMVVDNEQEALLLESNIIKQHRPPYNIIFKDDKNWLYLAIDYKEKFPRVELTRRTATQGVKYFGPYTSASTIRNSFRLLKKILALRTCVNPPDKPCFDSSLGRCLGHNFDAGSKKLYREKIKQLQEFLKGNSKYLLNKLTAEMNRAAKQQRFEQAARRRDNLKLLEWMLIKQKIITRLSESFDIIGLTTHGNLTSISKLPIRRGVLLESDQLLVEHDKKLPSADILANFLERYYPQVTDRPQKIFIPIKLAGLHLPIKTKVPERGIKKQLLGLAHKNAQNYLSNSLASWQKQSARATAGLAELKKVLKLKAPPQRIEGYDISNIQGQYAVGALVVLTNGLIDKSQYKKFTIKKVNGPNDVAMLAEILVRRFKANHAWPQPDLIMLDGGKPQLNTIIKIFKQKNIKIPLVTLAKKQEILFTPSNKQGIKLPSHSPALLLLEQLRDEAHRFGITFYRSRHRQSIKKSAD